MARKTRGIFQVLLKSILKGVPKKIEPKLMGEDYFGTKYFEEPPESSGRKTRGRFFKPVTPDAFDQEIPAEWEAWLRYRRSVPPTKEEIEANYKMLIMKRENAAKLEEQYARTKDVASLNDRDQQHTASTFPAYEEYHEFGKKFGKVKSDPENPKK